MQAAGQKRPVRPARRGGGCNGDADYTQLASDSDAAVKLQRKSIEKLLGEIRCNYPVRPVECQRLKLRKNVRKVDRKAHCLVSRQGYTSGTLCGVNVR